SAPAEGVGEKGRRVRPFPERLGTRPQQLRAEAGGTSDAARRRGAGGLPGADRTATADADVERHQRGRLSGAGPLTAPESTFRTVEKAEPRNLEAGGAEGTPGTIRGGRGVLKPSLVLRSPHVHSGMSNLGRSSILKK